MNGYRHRLSIVFLAASLCIIFPVIVLFSMLLFSHIVGYTTKYYVAIAIITSVGLYLACVLSLVSGVVFCEV